MKKKTVQGYAKRFCTYCGTYNMIYATVDGHPIGMCDCGNTDWCDRETEESIKAQIGKGRLIACDIDIILEE